MGPVEFREIISARRGGLCAAMIRALLAVLEMPYAAAMRIRNLRYDRGWARVHRAEVPVISVGNLTMGGTGKTPLVEWLVRRLTERGLRAGIVSRGYGASSGEQNDEARELAEKLPGVPHVLNPDRAAAALTATRKHGCEVIVLDDGFQHRRLARDLNIVLIDALEPFGFDHVFPRGMLREPAAGLARADVVALSRADMIDETRRRELQAEVLRYAPQAMWCEIAHAARSLRNRDGVEESLDLLRGQSVAAFCGIGNPAGFRHTLAQCGFEVVAFHEFADHHPYASDELDSLGQQAMEAGAAALVCTHKDLVKVGPAQLASIPLWALTVETEVCAGRAELESRLEDICRRIVRRKSNPDARHPE